MRILIDTNIYLNFYRLKGDSSLKLSKGLYNLLNSKGKKDIKLILPQQVKDEFYTHRDKVADEILDSLKGIRKIVKYNIGQLENASSISGGNNKSIKAIQKRFMAVHEKVLLDYEQEVLAPDGKLGKQLEKIMAKAVTLEETREILEDAHFRYLKGNPPRGEKPHEWFGDSIIWATILAHCTNYDLVVISDDKDWRKKKSKTKLHPFLIREWEAKSEKSIEYYHNIGRFLKSQGTDIEDSIIQEEESLPTITHNYLLSGINATAHVGPLSAPLSIGSMLGQPQKKCDRCDKDIAVWEWDNSSIGIGRGVDELCSLCRTGFTYPALAVMPYSECSECGKTIWDESPVLITDPIASEPRKCKVCRNKT